MPTQKEIVGQTIRWRSHDSRPLSPTLSHEGRGSFYCRGLLKVEGKQYAPSPPVGEGRGEGAH
jgi:hypothetical protein